MCHCVYIPGYVSEQNRQNYLFSHSSGRDRKYVKISKVSCMLEDSGWH